MASHRTRSTIRRDRLWVLTVALLATYAGSTRTRSSSPAGAGNEVRDRGANQADADKTPSRPTLAHDYGKLPLSFEINQGQSDPAVKFLSRGPGYTLFLTTNAAVLTLRSGSASSPAKALGAARIGRFGRGESPQNQLAAFRMTLVGANPRAKVVGLEELPGKANYFIGNDPTKWRNNVSTYAKVKYEHVYPGVDLVYYGNERQLEYDFVVAPGADPKAITLDASALSGDAAERAIAANGDLVIGYGSSEVRFHKPLVYQPGENGRRVIAGNFVLTGPHRIGFEVGAYDRGTTLVIDPKLAYSSYYGGSQDDVATAIKVDTAGAMYFVGLTSSPSDFPTHNNAQGYFGGFIDAFVAKLTPDGSNYVYSTYLGGGGDDYGYGIAIDPGCQLDCEVYVTGHSQIIRDDDGNIIDDQLFPQKNGLGFSRPQFRDAYIARLDASGQLAYSTLLGGNKETLGSGIVADSTHNAYVTGYLWGGGLTTKNAFQSTCSGGCSDLYTPDAWAVKIDTTKSGSDALQYSTYLGGTGADHGYAITVDASGYVYVAGDANTEDGFPTTVTGFGPRGGGSNSVYADDGVLATCDMSKSGTDSLVYSVAIGGSGFTDIVGAIAVDDNQVVYLTGTTDSTDFPTVNPLQSAPVNTNSPEIAFVSKIDTVNSVLLYSTYLGFGVVDNGSGIAFDSAGNIYVSGYTRFGFPSVHSVQDCQQPGGDGFVAKITPDGSKLAYSTCIGGTGENGAGGIALDSARNVYVVGFTAATDFPTVNPFQGLNSGKNDGFVSKIVLQPDFEFSPVASFNADVGLPGSTSVQVNSVDEFNAGVTLSVPMPPAGMTATFDPNPVTPPTDANKSSSMTLIIGPSVTPDTYAVSITGVSGALTHSVSTYLTVRATPAGVSQVISEDQALLCIDNPGVGNALTVKLARAQAFIDAGDIQAAINTLTALLNELRAQAGKHIKTTCKDKDGNPFDPVSALIKDVEALLTSLGANVIKPNPVMSYVVNSSNEGIPGATVSVIKSGSKAIVASTTTDVTGFYFFAQTRVFAIGSNYTIVVSPPKPYKTATSPTFMWKGDQLMVVNSVVN